MTEQEKKKTVVPMGRRSEETSGSARLANVGYALSLCECGLQRQTKLDY